MAKLIYLEFVCSNGHKTERLTDPNTQEVLCDVCDDPAQRIISTPRFQLEGVSGDFPTAADKWAKRHEEANRVARKRVEGRTQYDD